MQDLAGHAPDGFSSLPAAGRVFTAERRVRLGDAGPDRRARLDAVARFLQDVAEDDAAGAALSAGVGWVLRKTRIVVRRQLELDEDVRLDTFCSGFSSRWAERTTLLSVNGEPAMQAVSVWVAIDVATGMTTRLDQRFLQVYGPSAAGRRASARLLLTGPSDDVSRAARPWPLRKSDYDVWGHVNNAISWAAVEDGLEPTRWTPLLAEIEHVEPIGRDIAVPLLASQQGVDSSELWLLDAAPDAGDGNAPPRPRVLTAARLSPIFMQGRST